MAVILKKIIDENSLTKEISEIFKELNFNPAGKIFIKPNLGAREPIQRGENTSVEFMKALIEVLQPSVEEIIIGHSSLLGTADRKISYEKVIESSGYKQFETYLKVKLLNLDNIERVKFEFDNFIFHLPKFLVEKKVDYYINVGALKTHMETSISFSIKNQMGLLIGGERRALHHSGQLEKGIAYIGKFIKPDFNFIDSIWGMEGNGPHEGKSKKFDLIFAGKDMVELDSFAAGVVGLDYKKIEQIIVAKQIGVGNFVLPGIVEKYIKENIEFRPAKKFIKIGRKIYVWPTDACSMCITSVKEGGKLYTKKLLGVLNFSRKALFNKEDIHIVIGNGNNLDLRGKGKIIAVGQCPRKFAQRHGVDNLDKCPPTAEETFRYLKEKLK